MFLETQTTQVLLTSRDEIFRSGLLAWIIVSVLTACTGTLVGSGPPDTEDAGAGAPQDAALLDAGGHDGGGVTDARILDADATDVASWDGGFDAAPPELRIGHLGWLFDGETGGFQPNNAQHDGVDRNFCRPHPESIVHSNAIPRHSGDFGFELRLGEDWPWGAERCGGPRVLALSWRVEEAQWERDSEVWIGWAVLVPEDWEQDQRQMVVQMHRSGFGPHFWFEVSGDDDGFKWRISAKAALPELHDAPIEVTDVVAGRWHEFVARAVVSQDSSLGSIRVWEKLQSEREFELAAEYSGPTAVPDSALTRTSSAFPVDVMLSIEDIGATAWNDDGFVHIYFDEVRVGGAESGMDEVAPGSNVVISLSAE